MKTTKPTSFAPLFVSALVPAFVLLVVLLALLVSACEENNYPTTPSDPTEKITIFTTARVIAGVGSIAFEDTSTTIPSGRISTVFVQVRDSTGRTTDSANVASGGEITFTGYAPGEYTVEQTVTLDTQREGPTVVHGPLTVT